MLRKGSKARAQRPEQCIGRQLFMGWGSLHSPHLSDVKRVEPWDGRPIVAEMSTKRHKRFRDECSLLGSSGNCCMIGMDVRLCNGTGCVRMFPPWALIFEALSTFFMCL